MTGIYPSERLNRSHPLERVAPQSARESLIALLSRNRESIIANWRREQDRFLYYSDPVDGPDVVSFGFAACLELLSAGSIADTGNLLARYAAPGETPVNTASRLQHVFSTMCSALTPVVVECWSGDVDTQRQAISLLLGAMDLGVSEVCCALEQVVLERTREADEHHLRCLEDLARLVTKDSLRIVPSRDIPRPRQGRRLAIRYASDAAEVRRAVVAAGDEVEMQKPRMDDLSLAVGEAVSNVIRHAGEGIAYIWCSGKTVFVRVDDRGDGIAVENLPNVVSSGWSSEVSLGMGFTLMLELSDAVWLSSGPEGTSICMEKSADGRQSGVSSGTHPATARYLA